MRLNINLASQPYEAARRYLRQMGALLAALGLITAFLVGYIVYQRVKSRTVNAQLAQVQHEIDSLNHEEAQARAILNKPTNRVVADQSQFLNELFARKALSWTRVFTELERIMPANLHVVSMKPDYAKTGDLVLHVVVATDNRDRAVELVRRMEKSNHFRQPEVVAESVTANSSDQSTGGNIQFDVAAVYLPNAPDNPPDAPPAPPAKAAVAPKPAPAAAPVPAAGGAQAQNRPMRPIPRQH